jgi:hypothetical protein
MQELKRKLCTEYYEGGLIYDKDFREIEPDDGGIESQLDLVWDIRLSKKIQRPDKLAKNRYQIPLSLLGDVDLAYLQDSKIIYQPFLRESDIISWPYWNREFLTLTVGEMAAQAIVNIKG